MLLAPQLLLNLLMGDAAAFVEFSSALFDLGDHIEVIENFLERAAVGQTVEKRANGFLGFQDHLPRHRSRVPCRL